MSKTKSKLPQKEESVVNKAKAKGSTSKVAKPVEKKAATPRPTIASLAKELEDTKVMYETIIKGKDAVIDEITGDRKSLYEQLVLAERPWYIKIFDLFANK